MPLTNKVVLLTGASRGIGAAIARSLARANARLALHASTITSLEPIVAELRELGADVLPLPCDLTFVEEAEGLVQRAVDHYGHLNVLINNAGMGVFGPTESMTTADIERVLAVNLRAPFLLCREAITHLRACGDGAIINIASVVAMRGYPKQAAYTASKHGLLGLSKSLTRELQPDGISVHTICPGGVDTDMIGDARPDLDRSQLIRPEEIADIVVFLLTREGNGAIDRIDIRRFSADPWD